MGRVEGRIGEVHYKQLTGKRLRQMLLADGWTIFRETPNSHYVHMVKDKKHIGFYLDRVIPLKQVTAVAKNRAGWNVKRFNELFHQIIPLRAVARR